MDNFSCDKCPHNQYNHGHPEGKKDHVSLEKNETMLCNDANSGDVKQP